MNKASVQAVKPGLYRVLWKGGGESLASVGMNACGERWLAPTNWISPSHAQRSWRAVKRLIAVSAHSTARGE